MQFANPHAWHILWLLLLPSNYSNFRSLILWHIPFNIFWHRLYIIFVKIIFWTVQVTIVDIHIILWRFQLSSNKDYENTFYLVTIFLFRITCKNFQVVVGSAAVCSLDLEKPLTDFGCAVNMWLNVWHLCKTYSSWPC